MHNKGQFRNVMFAASWRPESAVLAIMLMLLFLMFVLLFITLTAQSVQAQTFTVIHNFTGGGDGQLPAAGLTIDKAGNLYGTTVAGGSGTHGVVFKLRYSGSGWVLTPLYSFAGGNDGASPLARVTIGPNGSVYGTTYAGGGGGCFGVGCGTVFNLRPPPHACQSVLCPWTETVLYRFTGGSGGGDPQGALVFDHEGNIYGTTSLGTVFELTPSDGSWTESVLYSFEGGGGGEDGVIFDTDGNLYGATYYGGTYGYGTVYELTPSGSGWIANTLYAFQSGSDGGNPMGGLIFDKSGNLYGTTTYGGSGNGGTVFELSPSNGGWTFSTLYSFTTLSAGIGPYDSLIFDASGNLYGTTYSDGAYAYGSVFELTPSNSGWTYTSLHDFTNGSDGRNPEGNVIFDANGNLYGTASGGAYGIGVAFKITP